MWCVIPAAGDGTRMGNAAGSVPKPLLPVGDATLIERILRDVGAVVDRACLVVPPGESRIRSALGNTYRGMPLAYAVQEEPRGVGDAVCAARDLVDGPAAVVMGDACFGEPLAPYLAAWRDSGVPAAVPVRPLVAAPRETAGLVRVSRGRVTAIRKGTDPEGFTHRVCGVFLLPARALDACGELEPSASGEVEVESLVRALRAAGVEVAAPVYRGWRRNVNTPGDLRAVRARLAGTPRKG